MDIKFSKIGIIHLIIAISKINSMNLINNVGKGLIFLILPHLCLSGILSLPARRPRAAVASCSAVAATRRCSQRRSKPWRRREPYPIHIE